MTVTSMLSVFTMPLWLKAILRNESGTTDGTSFNLNFDIGKMLWQLIVTVLAPAVLGKLLRELWKPAGRFAKKYKEYLGMFGVSNLAFIVWQTLSGAQEILVQQAFVNIVYIIIAASLQHVTYLIFNALVLRLAFSIAIEEAIAVWIMSSQKSAPVAVTVITYLTSQVSSQGILSLPCIIGQLIQIFLGSSFAPFVASKVRKSQEAKRDSVSQEHPLAAGEKDEVVVVVMEKKEEELTTQGSGEEDATKEIGVLNSNQPALRA